MKKRERRASDQLDKQFVEFLLLSYIIVKVCVCVCVCMCAYVQVLTTSVWLHESCSAVIYEKENGTLMAQVHIGTCSMCQKITCSSKPKMVVCIYIYINFGMGESRYGRYPGGPQAGALMLLAYLKHERIRNNSSHTGSDVTRVYKVRVRC